jgi:hypothetical protein
MVGYSEQKSISEIVAIVNLGGSYYLSDTIKLKIDAKVYSVPNFTVTDSSGKTKEFKNELYTISLGVQKDF